MKKFNKKYYWIWGLLCVLTSISPIYLILNHEAYSPDEIAKITVPMVIFQIIFLILFVKGLFLSLRVGKKGKGRSFYKNNTCKTYIYSELQNFDPEQNLFLKDLSCINPGDSVIFQPYHKGDGDFFTKMATLSEIDRRNKLVLNHLIIRSRELKCSYGFDPEYKYNEKKVLRFQFINEKQEKLLQIGNKVKGRSFGSNNFHKFDEK